jgi:hypothetical protein
MQPEYAGVTLNERLATAGLLEQFDRVARDRDRLEMLRLLHAVELERREAEYTVDSILADPKKYGF